MKKSDKHSLAYQALLHTVTFLPHKCTFDVSNERKQPVAYNEEWEPKIEILEITPKIFLSDFSAEQDLSETETSAEYDDYSPSIINEYFARTPRT